jgi:hypothetical protein
MSPATDITLPVRMRIGGGEEIEVGTITLDLVDGQATPDMPGVKAELAAMLRSAADAVEAGADE